MEKALLLRTPALLDIIGSESIASARVLVREIKSDPVMLRVIE